MHEPRSVAELLDEILAALPTETAVVAHGADQRLVASAAGVFVLDPDHQGPAADRAATAAQSTRELLAQHLSWVPFIDWFVVSRADPDDPVHDVVPLDLVAATVLEGHAVRADVVDGIRRLLRSGAFAPRWHHGLPTLAPTPRIG